MKTSATKFYLFGLLLLIGSSSLFGIDQTELKRQKKELSELKKLVTKFKEKDLISHLREFIFATRPNRIPGEQGHDKARAFIKKAIEEFSPQNPAKVQLFKPNFSKMGEYYEKEFQKKIAPAYSKLSPEFKNWSQFLTHIKSLDQKFLKLPGQNIIWEKKGRDSEKVLVIGVSYDSITFDYTNYKFNLGA